MFKFDPPPADHQASAIPSRALMSPSVSLAGARLKIFQDSPRIYTTVGRLPPPAP